MAKMTRATRVRKNRRARKQRPAPRFDLEALVALRGVRQCLAFQLKPRDCFRLPTENLADSKATGRIWQVVGIRSGRKSTDPKKVIIQQWNRLGTVRINGDLMVRPYLLKNH